MFLVLSGHTHSLPEWSLLQFSPHLPFGPCAFCNEIEEESYALDTNPFSQELSSQPLGSPCYLVDGASWHQKGLALM